MSNVDADGSLPLTAAAGCWRSAGAGVGVCGTDPRFLKFCDEQSLLQHSTHHAARHSDAENRAFTDNNVLLAPFGIMDNVSHNSALFFLVLYKCD